MEQKPLLLNIKHGFNFRDLGSYKTLDGRKIKKHKILRSANLAYLSERDVNYLDDYGLRYDVDFRSISEKEVEPDRISNNVHYHFNPVFSEDETRSTKKDQETRYKTYSKIKNAGFEDMLKAYKDIVLTDGAKKAYRQFFDLLLANDKENEALLLHCTAGKDRTAMGAVYLLTALGVDSKIIHQDYLASNIYTETVRAKKIADVSGMGPVMSANIKALFEVSEAYLNHALQLMKDNFGGINNYLHTELKLNEQEVSDLRKIYLTDK